MGQFSAFAEQPQWAGVIDRASLVTATQKIEQQQSWAGFARATQTAALLFACLIGVMLFFIVVDIVRKRAAVRREELLLHRMSGAEEISVIVPFATEITVLLLMALIGSAGVFLLILAFLPTAVPLLSVPLFTTVLVYGPVLLLLQLLISPAIGYLGAKLGVR
jgi:cell division protein FtsX